MNNESDLFKHFKNPAESGKKHRTQIQRFLKDKSHTILAITSIQGSGKTTAIIDEFSRSRDAILLTQSNQKMLELMEIIHRKYPELDYMPMFGLEQICSTFLSEQPIQDYVSELRKIGLLTDDIHKLICHDDHCSFLTQSKELNGRIIQTVARFESEITLGHQYHGLYSGRLILIDEADGLLNQKPTNMPLIPFENHRIDHSSPYLPQIYLLNTPEGTLNQLMLKYRNLIHDVDGNKEEIRNTTELIRLVTQGFYSIQNGKNSELPPVFFIFKTVLERRMKLAIGTATMRNHRINFRTMQDYFQLAFEYLFENNRIKAASDTATEKQISRSVNLDEYLNQIKPEIMEFEADYIPGFTDIYVFQSHKHSYSKSHFKAFKGDEESRQERWRELRKELITALRFFELQSGKNPMKILVITFTEVMNEIERRQKRLNKGRNLSHDPLLSRIDKVLPLFSNRMHGVNANLEGFDLIITVGDPLDATTARFATDTGIIDLNRKGFSLRKEADPAVKAMVLRTMLSELLEAFHRGRSEIPIIALSNFLAPEKDDLKFVKQVLEADNFKTINVYSKLWHLIHDTKKRKGNWKKNKVFLSSVAKEIEFDLSEK